MPVFSILVSNYNQDLNSVLRSLYSVTEQDFADVELLYLDDCSKNSYALEVRKFLETHCPFPFKLIINPENLGTVKNFLNGVESSSGIYIKCLGAGDILASKDTLRKLRDRIEENPEFDIFFADIQTYTYISGEIKIGSYNAPTNPKKYIYNQNHQKLFYKMILTADWIPGSAQIFKRDTYINYLNKLIDEYNDKYVEDFAATVALMEKEILYINTPVIWYEFGVGISSNKNKNSRIKMYNDNLNLYKKLAEDNQKNILIFIAYTLYRLRRFIALKTPFYDCLVKIVMKKQTGAFCSVDNSESKENSAKDFLNRVLKSPLPE